MFQTNPVETFLAYSEARRPSILGVAGLFALGVAFADWSFTEISVGFLYIIPVLLASSALNGFQIVASAVVFSLLREQFHPLAWQPGVIIRFAAGLLGFGGAGFFVSELNRLRRVALGHLRALERQVRLRQETEEQLRILIETSPLAIVILNDNGLVLLANQSARDLLGFGGEPLQGQDIRPYLPVLVRPLGMRQHSMLRTNVECTGQRRDGEVFLAQIWLSTFTTADELRLAAVIWDGSESLRDREGSGLDSMIDTSRVLIGAMSHEVRNLSNLAVAAYGNLEVLPGTAESKDYHALGAMLRALEKIASSGLRIASDRTAATVNLYTVLDETRIVIEPGFREGGMEIHWIVPEGLPLVQSDHHNLLQVFLNLARNSSRAMELSEQKQLQVEASLERDLVIVRFRDTGPGVADPSNLFQPFQPGAHAAGLGLYISKEILLSSGGDLRYEPQALGGCFAVELWPVELAVEAG